jgi:methyl-accepting chemotaxis protein
MSFIDDMKIGKKLLGGFLVVVVILAIVAIFGYTTSTSAAAAANDIYDQHLTKISYLGDVQADFQQMRAEVYR